MSVWDEEAHKAHRAGQEADFVEAKAKIIAAMLAYLELESLEQVTAEIIKELDCDIVFTSLMEAKINLAYPIEGEAAMAAILEIMGEEGYEYACIMLDMLQAPVFSAVSDTREAAQDWVTKRYGEDVGNELGIFLENLDLSKVGHSGGDE